MIDRKAGQGLASGYDKRNVKVGVLASHSALDVAEGAVEEGFRSVLYCRKGREKTYAEYFKSKRAGGKIVRGVVDEFKVYDKFTDMMAKKEQDEMLRNNVLFIPNRSFSSYINVKEIEDSFRVPMVGSRNMLSSEERGGKQDYYWLLEK